MSHFLIRCDASPAIGVGHFMRTYCLANELQSRGHAVCFAMRATTPMVDAILQESQLAQVRLESDARCMVDELPLLMRLIEHWQSACVIVDHYDATPAYLSNLHTLPIALGVVDDLADRDLTAADWILNQNLGADNLTYRTRAGCRRLLGTRFCLLRPQFTEARRELQRRFSANDRRVLITLGGGAMLPVVTDILAALENAPIALVLRVIIAGDYGIFTGNKTGLGSARHTLEILHNVTNMAEHMAWADVSINAGGSTTWELCSLGVSMIIVPLSRDQIPVAGLLEREGCAARVQPDAVVDQLAPLLVRLLQSAELRSTMSRKGQALIDGSGAKRAALSLEEIACLK